MEDCAAIKRQRDQSGDDIVSERTQEHAKRYRKRMSMIQLLEWGINVCPWSSLHLPGALSIPPTIESIRTWKVRYDDGGSRS